MKHIFSFLFSLTILIGCLATSQEAFAQTNDLLGVGYGASSGLGGSDIRLMVARIIRTALSLLGVAAVSFIVYGGFLMMTSAGESDQVGKGRSILTYAIIGLVIIMSAWSITTFVLRSTFQATTGQATTLGGQIL